MTNKELLERASKLQKEFTELYNQSELAAIYESYIHIMPKLFHECEREGLLEHISETFNKKKKRWDLEAMTQDGVRVIAIEDSSERKGK